MAANLHPQSLEAFFDRLLEAMRSNDPRRVAALCTEDVVFDDAGEERTLVGRDALIELLGTIYGIAADQQVDLIAWYTSSDGATAAARWRRTGTLRDPLGRIDQIETAEFYEFRKGLISHWTLMVRDLDWLGRQWGA